MHRAIQKIHHTYQKHKRTIHSLIVVKVFVIALILLTTQSQRQSRAQSISTALGISIVNSYSGSISLITDTMTYSGGYRYISGNTISIEHLGSTGGIQLGISGDIVAAGIISAISYPGSGVSSVVLSSSTGILQIQTRTIKDGREFILGPSYSLIVQTNTPTPPPTNSSNAGGGGGSRYNRNYSATSSRSQFSQSYGSVMNTTGLNYWSDCIEGELNKNIPYKICLLEQSSAFKRDILKPRLNKDNTIKDRISAMNLLYDQISYQDPFIQKHTRFRKAVQQITKNRNNRIVNRSMLKLQQAVITISTQRLQRVWISKEQLLREIKYVVLTKIQK